MSIAPIPALSLSKGGLLLRQFAIQNAKFFYLHWYEKWDVDNIKDERRSGLRVGFNQKGNFGRLWRRFSTKGRLTNCQSP